MGYQIDGINTKTNLDSLNSYYQGNNTGTLFFRSPTASNPYSLTPGRSNGMLIDARYNNGYISGDMVITTTRVSPYFAPYQRSGSPLLFGDEDQYVIAGFGLQSPVGGNNSYIQWMGNVAVSGPALTDKDIGDVYTVEYQLYYYDATYHAYRYYYHPPASGEYSWTTTETTNQGSLYYGGSHTYIYFNPPITGVWYQFKIRLVKINNTNKKSPWTGIQMQFSERKQEQGSFYRWDVELRPLNSAYTIPYSSTKVFGRSLWDTWTMIPLYGDHVIDDADELNWD